MRKEDYEEVYSILSNAGFTNIELIPLEDINTFTFWKKEGEVDFVSINGDDSFTISDWFPCDATVKIEYHSKP